MPLTRIKQTAIGADAITTAKLDDTAGGLTLPGVQYVHVPVGTTAQRPSSPENGHLRYNTQFARLEQYAGGAWQAIDSPPAITTLAYSGSKTAADPAGGETVTITGSNFQAGGTVTIGGTAATSVSIVSASTVTFVVPAKTAGDYNVVFTNSNGLSANLVNGISYNGTPAFSTAAGNVGTIIEDDVMPTITIVAAEPDGGTVAFSITSGALPTGVSLGSANGQLTGTPNTNVTSNTTFNFTVTATDDENQTNARAFNLIVLRPIYATQISNSLLMTAALSTKLSRTPSSASNRKTWTWSGWIKRDNEGGAVPFSSYQDADDYFNIQITGSNTLQVIDRVTGNYPLLYNSTQIFKDGTAWQHLVVAVDTTQATNTNRVKAYLNGEQITAWASQTHPSQNHDTHVNKAQSHIIGERGNASQKFDGSISDVHFIDGQALTPTSFGESVNDVWVPKTFSGTYGTNGFKLTFADSSNLGDDTSGNTNDFTGTNLNPRNSIIDSPTVNFATLNYYDRRNGATLQNLKVSNPNVNSTVTSTMGLPSGKWYWEVICPTNTAPYIGVQRVGEARTGYSLGGTAVNRIGNIYSDNADKSINGTASWNANDVIGVAYDADNDRIQWSVNGQWYTANAASASTETISNVAAGTSAFDLSHPGTASGGLYASTGKIVLLPYFGTSTAGTVMTVNFGQNPSFHGAITAGTETDGNGIGLFKYPPPSGYLACCSKNVADDTDIDVRKDVRPDNNMKCITYTGNATARSFTGLGFQPDLVWIKDRVGTYNYQLYDSLRGPTGSVAGLITNTNAAAQDYSAFTSFDSDGFTITGVDGVNKDTRGHVAWCWKAGGAPTATNVAAAGAVPTAGSVKIDGANKTDALAGTLAAKELSANTAAGFSIIRWTGAGADCSIAHGLNKKVEFFMTKSLSEARNWEGFHKNLSTGYIVYWNLAYGQNNAGSTYFQGGYQDNLNTNTTIPLSSYIAQSAKDMVGYAWHSVPGYSDIGYYVGNNSADGPMVQTGFKPGWLMITKVGGGTGNGSSWFVMDNARDPVNNTNKYILNSNAVTGDGVGSAATTTAINWLANGFKVTNSGSGGMNEADVYIYMAFAADPFKYTEAV
jgi:hypothetical protein